MKQLLAYLDENRGVALNLGVAIYGFLIDPLISGPVHKLLSQGGTNYVLAALFLGIFCLEIVATPYKLSTVFNGLLQKGQLHGHLGDDGIPKTGLGVLLFGSALFRLGIFMFVLGTGLRASGITLDSRSPEAQPWIIGIAIFGLAKETFFMVYAIRCMKRTEPRPIADWKGNLGDGFYLLFYDFFFTIFFGGVALKSSIITHPESFGSIVAEAILAGLVVCFFYIPLRLPYVLEEYFRPKGFKQWLILLGSFALAISAALRPVLTEVFDGRYTSLAEAQQAPSTVRKLFLQRQQIEALPENIGQMTQLEQLHLYNNRLTTLPRSVGRLTKLRKVNVMFNRLTSLPPEIGRWKELRVLKLYRNKLRQIPHSVGQWQKLEHLDLQHNQLTTLPASLCTLKKLKYLSIRNNPIKALPPCFEDLWKRMRRRRRRRRGK